MYISEYFKTKNKITVVRINKYLPEGGKTIVVVYNMSMERIVYFFFFIIFSFGFYNDLK